MRILLLLIVMCDGMCCLRLNTAMRTPFDTGYRYVRDHASSVISLSSPYFVSTSPIVRLGSSGGGMAILIRLMPIPAICICTIDKSLLSCLNSICPFVAWRIYCIHSFFANFMKTRRLGTSTCITCTSFFGSFSSSYIHLCIWYAVIRGLLGSNGHTHTHTL